MAFSSLLLLLSYLSSSLASYSPIPPSVDAFYQPPADLQKWKHGDILRSRILPKPAGLSVAINATYQLLFRTTDSNGLARAATTTILVPFNATKEKLFSMQNAYDSVAIDCAPSYQLYNPDSTIPERAVIDLALSQGWYISVPDFGGAFTNGISSGQIVLDSLRAVLHSGSITGLSDCARIVLAGVSGGALGSEWALELHDSYAPELEISGALLTALTPNVTSVLQTVDGTVNSVLIPMGVLGMASQSLELSGWLGRNLMPQNFSTSLFLQASQRCLTEFAMEFGAQNVSKTYFGRANALLDPIPQAVIRSVGIMGQHGIPRVPMFVYKGTEDEVSPVGDTDALVQKYCDAGSRIMYQRAVNATHQESGVYGVVAGWEWVKERMEGVEVKEGCNRKDVVV